MRAALLADEESLVFHLDEMVREHGLLDRGAEAGLELAYAERLGLGQVLDEFEADGMGDRLQDLRGALELLEIDMVEEFGGHESIYEHIFIYATRLTLDER